LDMQVVVLEGEQKYTGGEIRPQWAYREYDVKGDSIIVFRGPMAVEEVEMVDMEDRGAGLEIKGSDCLHLLVEHFDCQPPSLLVAYTRQRLLCCLASEMLGPGVERRGDDLFFQGRKLSVSVATVSPGSMKIHLGFNITNQGTPEDVETACLPEVDVEDPLEFGRELAERYSREIQDIYGDMAKTRTL